MAARDAAIVEERLRNNGSDVVFTYRWEHVQAVVRLAIVLAKKTGADAEVVEAAAWLHDIVKAQSEDHGRDGAIAARRILAGTDYPPIKIEAVADAISQHVGLWRENPSAQIEPIEAAVLWDADKLSKLGVTAVLHFTGYLVNKGEGTTAQLTERLCELDWQERIVESFNTEQARAAGEKRIAFLHAFCAQARLEFDGDDLFAEIRVPDSSSRCTARCDGMSGSDPSELGSPFSKQEG